VPRRREATHARGNAEWWFFGAITGAALLVELALAGRLLVQLTGERGFLADIAYLAGGFLQQPFAPDTSQRVGSRSVFEPETITALAVYASIAVALPSAWIGAKLLRLLYRLSRVIATLSVAGGRAGRRLSIAGWRRAEPVLVDWDSRFGILVDEACRRAAAASVRAALWASTMSLLAWDWLKVNSNLAWREFRSEALSTWRQARVEAGHARVAMAAAADRQKGLMTSDARVARLTGREVATQAQLTAAVLAEGAKLSLQTTAADLRNRSKTLGPRLKKPDSLLRLALAKVDGWSKSRRPRV
jgi:hypothetical protein